jgi:hypothetical protein
MEPAGDEQGAGDDEQDDDMLAFGDELDEPVPGDADCTGAAPSGKRTKHTGPLSHVSDEVIQAAVNSLPLPLDPEAGAADPRCDDGSCMADNVREESWYLRYGPREDFSASQLGILGVWLHSVRYRGKSPGGGTWEFGCGLPSWAQRAAALGGETATKN